jgi:hypothetical protein
MSHKLLTIVSVLVLSAVILSACGPSAPATSAPVYVYWNYGPTEEKNISTFIAQEQGIGMSDAQLREYYIVHNISWTEWSAGALADSLQMDNVYALPAGATPAELALPSGSVIASSLLMSGFAYGATVAFAYTLTPAYVEKMKAVAVPLPRDAKVMVPTFSTLALDIQLGNLRQGPDTGPGWMVKLGGVAIVWYCLGGTDYFELRQNGKLLNSAQTPNPRCGPKDKKTLKEAFTAFQRLVEVGGPVWKALDVVIDYYKK